ncbi:MAG: hypothetical protein IT376_06660 [Polyangiaceae bacterium]|nr:hypothetical protein [Polyangiaceae bacterium]
MRRASRRSRTAWAGGVGASLWLAGACGGGDPVDRQQGDDWTCEGPTEPVPFVDPQRVERADLLLVVDDSLGMQDKQPLLADAVPRLVQRLVDPPCVDAEGTVTGPAPGGSGGTCPAGQSRQFPPIRDLHVGVITSSLGSAGGDICPGTGSTGGGDDHGRLVPAVRAGLPDPGGAGFLAWGAGAQPDPAAFAADLRAHVLGAGADGCGYEAPLEAWYRFLVDPAPPRAVIRTTEGITDRERDAAGQPVLDDVVLAQRAAFLRPDSLVLIAMLTDENDCSLRDSGLAWVIGSNEPMLGRATAACATDPNSPCCRFCIDAEAVVPEGCAPLDQDSECARGPLSAAEDQVALRCFDQQRRFGIELLHPVGRYVAGLKDLRLCPASPYGDADCSCRGERRRRDALGLPFDARADCADLVGLSVPNPLLLGASAGGGSPRDPGRVFFAGVVGVPWQDLADDASLAGPGLTYLSASELEARGRWDVLVGDPARGVPPSDPFLRETWDQRLDDGQPIPHPLVPEVTTTPPGVTNPINGNEYEIAGHDDLQYACTFPLPTPRDCTTAPGLCACRPGLPATATRPLCEAGTAVQVRSGAYPGTRPLALLRDLGDQAVVASICPKVLTGEPTAAGYGLGPAFDALAERAREVLAPWCLPRALPVDPVTGRSACAVHEVRWREEGGACGCDEPGRAPAGAAATEAARVAVHAETGSCGALCVCELTPASSRDYAPCQTEPSPELARPGWCYVEEGPLVQDCAPERRRRLHFVSTAESSLPAPGSTLLLSCPGSALEPIEAW